MKNITNKVSERDIRFYRRLRRNLLFSEIQAFFVDRAKKDGIRKRHIAQKLGKDPAQITRWLSEPANLTIDSVSDLLLALDGELQINIVPAREEYSIDEAITNYRNWVDSQEQSVNIIRTRNESSDSPTSIANLAGIEKRPLEAA